VERSLRGAQFLVQCVYSFSLCFFVMTFKTIKHTSTVSERKLRN